MYKGKLNKAYSAYVFWGLCRKSRASARAYQKKLVANRGFSSVNSGVKRRIKEYCRETFGSASYWPWLAAYTEIRGSFREGWMPNEFYLYEAIPRLNPPIASQVSLAKTLDYRLFGDICVKPLLVIVNHLLFDGDYHRIEKQAAERIIRNSAMELVVKKDGSSGGYEVSFVQPSALRLEKLIGAGSFVIQPLVTQHEALSKVYPHSLNTIRVYTYLDSHSQVSVNAILLTFGAGGKRVNNASADSRFLCIGPNGKPISGAFNRANGLLIPEYAHPDTGFVYEQIQVPNLQQVVDMCMEAHYRYPYAGFIVWDCYLDEEGNPKLIEWNAKIPAFHFIEAIIGPCFDMDELKQRINRAG